MIAFAWAHWAWLKLATTLPVSVFSISMLVIPVVGVMPASCFSANARAGRNMPRLSWCSPPCSALLLVKDRDSSSGVGNAALAR